MADIFHNSKEARDRLDMDKADAADWYEGQYGHGDETAAEIFSRVPDCVARARSNKEDRKG